MKYIQHLFKANLSLQIKACGFSTIRAPWSSHSSQASANVEEIPPVKHLCVFDSVILETQFNV